MKKRDDYIHCLELFAGCGGLALGLARAGVRHRCMIESNRHAVETLRQNFPQTNIFDEDIRYFPDRQIAETDLVSGGPPCQPFSLGGRHRGHCDDRDMFPYAINIVAKTGCRAFLFENVKGLLRIGFRDYFEYIILRLTYPSISFRTNEDWSSNLSRLRKIKEKERPEYTVFFKTLNSADYGVPQRRERVFIFGCKPERARAWGWPGKTHSKEMLLWDKFITGEYWDRHRIPKARRERASAKEIEGIKRRFAEQDGTLLGKAWVTIRDALASVSIVQPEGTGSGEHLRPLGARAYPGHAGSDIDWPSKTIKAGSHGVPGGENMIKDRSGQYSYMTTYEAKILQTFPSNFEITGVRSEAMRQIGNAVPPSLAEVVGWTIRDCLS